jgi:hypothetical protein
MAPQSNEIAYSNEFVGNLHGQIEPVPARVYTMMRLMSAEAARQFKSRAPVKGAPQYVFHGDENLPMHPSLLAMGSHSFTW